MTTSIFGLHLIMTSPEFQQCQRQAAETIERLAAEVMRAPEAMLAAPDRSSEAEARARIYGYSASHLIVDDVEADG